MKTSLYVFSPYSGIGGGDTTLIRFLKSINLKKYNVTIFTLEKVKKISKKIKIIKLAASSTLMSFIQIKKIILDDNSLKKIFFSMQYFVNVPAIFFLSKIKNLKMIIYEINHPDQLKYSENTIQFFKNKILNFLVKKIYHKADIVSSNSKELSKDLSALINKKVEIIYNPCFFKIKKRNKDIKNSKITILNIARFERQKDHLTLLKAINHSKVKNNIRLNLVGYGTREKLIKDYINKNNIDCKIYKSKKLSSFYRSSDLFILTSLYEGLPTVMVEAASHCMPIITSQFKSGSSEILNNGKFGFVFPVKDFRALSKIIENFYKNPKIFFKKEKLCRKNIKKFSNKKSLIKFNYFLDKLSN